MNDEVPSMRKMSISTDCGQYQMPTCLRGLP